jgi:hemolysin activation/secretion protein
MKNEKSQFKSMQFAVGAFLLSGAIPATAQVAAPRLSVPDAGHVLSPPAVPNVSTHEAPVVQQQLELPQNNAATVHFTGVRIVGAQVLDPHKIESVFSSYKDRDVSTIALKTALDGVNALYADAGYPLGRAYIPIQRLKDGVLTVYVVEGYVGKIIVTASDEKTKKLIARMAATLTSERPLTRAHLERTLLLIQEVPGITLGSKFDNMDPKTGATDLIIAASMRTVAVGFSFNNRAGLNALPVQPYMSATANNLLGLGDQITATTLLSPRPKDYAFYDLAMSSLTTSDGLSGTLDGSWAQALDDVSLRPYDVRSRSAQLSSGLRYPLMRALDESLTVSGRAYYASAVYSLDGPIHAVFAKDKNLVSEVGADYARAFSTDLVLGSTVRFTQGIDSYGGEPHTRLHTIAGFTKFRAENKLVWRPLEMLALNFSAMGQYSPVSLIASEEVAFGGLQYGRGFQASEISGDSGIGFSFQPEYTINLSSSWNLTPFALLDYAKAYNKRLEGQPSPELVSSGGGVKIGFGGFATVTLELDKPINRIPLDRRDKSVRFFAGVELGVDKALSLIEETL